MENFDKFLETDLQKRQAVQNEAEARQRKFQEETDAKMQVYNNAIMDVVTPAFLEIVEAFKGKRFEASMANKNLISHSLNIAVNDTVGFNVMVRGKRFFILAQPDGFGVRVKLRAVHSPMDINELIPTVAITQERVNKFVADAWSRLPM